MCNENNDMEDCTFYLQQIMQERSKFLFSDKLCYKCLETVTKELNAKTCSSRRLCKFYSGKHVTI